MSEVNVELIRSSWDASMGGDWPAALATLDPDADIRDLDVPDASVGARGSGEQAND